MLHIDCGEVKYSVRWDIEDSMACGEQRTMGTITP